MVKLIFSPIASLDGYLEDERGKFDWAAPDDEVHAFVNDLERPIGTYLYGRRMYETMVSWETVSGGANQPAVIRDFAEIWRAAEKIVFSRTLQTVASARTHIERTFDPDAVHADPDVADPAEVVDRHLVKRRLAAHGRWSPACSDPAQDRRQSPAIRRDLRHWCVRWSAILGDQRRFPKREKPRACRASPDMELGGLEPPTSWVRSTSSGR
jgi:hypothetical protein